jgi:hypothetical protein
MKKTKPHRIVSLTIVPLTTSILIEAYRLSKYTGVYSKTWRKRKTGHVVIICAAQIRVSYLDSFLGELFHPHHGEQAFDAVLLFDGEPDRTMEVVLQERSYSSRLLVYIGSATKEEDLLRVRMQDAQACFILPTRYSDEKKVLNILFCTFFSSPFPTSFVSNFNVLMWDVCLVVFFVCFMALSDFFSVFFFMFSSSSFSLFQMSNDGHTAMKCISIKRFAPTLPVFFLVADAEPGN